MLTDLNEGGEEVAPVRHARPLNVLLVVVGHLGGVEGGGREER